ncbi:MAG: division/cell wall cluster transcriptional repressor MraZ [Desulfopila sp.]
MKSRFRSRSEHTLDGKGRLNFPSRFRDVLAQYESEVLMVAPWGNTHLRGFPIPEWEAFENTMMTKGSRQEGMARLLRYIVGSVAECPLDKQGRILLPQYLREDAKLQKEVVLVGMLSHVEIWDKERWREEYEDTGDRFSEFDAKFTEMGIY